MSLTKEELKKGEWYLFTPKNSLIGGILNSYLYKFDKISAERWVYRTLGAYMRDGEWRSFNDDIGYLINHGGYTITKADMKLVKRLFPSERVRVMFHEVD